MNQTTTTFWDHVYDLRERRLIPREWKSGDLRKFLQEPAGPFKPNTINSLPQNSSVSKLGDSVGDYVKKGGASKAWKVSRGQFTLIADPEDDLPTQEEEKRKAADRAEELRSRKKEANGRQEEAAKLVPHPSNRLTMQAGPVSAYPGRYQAIPVALTPETRQSLGRHTTEQKAEAIVLMYLIDKYGDQVKIEEDRNGADLRVSKDGKTERIEVKGTERSDIAWSQLKVSSQKSHDALKSGDATMYRVVGVNSVNPRVYILTYGRHFTLEPEPRWAVKRVPLEDDRYPLRGEPYRYDLPYGPVAMDEWEVQE